MLGLKSLFTKITGNKKNKDDDLYGGYSNATNEFASIEALAGEPSRGPPGALRGSNSNKPPATAAHRVRLVQDSSGMARPTTSKPFSRSTIAGADRPTTRGGVKSGASSGTTSDNRPMTSNRGAGYTKEPVTGKRVFDPFRGGTGSRGPTEGLQKKADSSPMGAIQDLEEKVHQALEDSAEAAKRGDMTAALDRAKEAGRRERSLRKAIESAQLAADLANQDLTFCVVLSLAHAYTLNKQYSQAINAYNTIVKSGKFAQASWLRVNLGNIYYIQQQYAQAVKMYRMALDQVPNTMKVLRVRIQKNIAAAQVALGKYHQAVEGLNQVVDSTPDPVCPYNMLLCAFALGDIERVKKAYELLLKVAAKEVVEQQDERDAMDTDYTPDELHAEVNKRRARTKKLVLTASRLIAPTVERSDFAAGYDWCVSRLMAANCAELAHEVELAKASAYLVDGRAKEAIDIYKDRSVYANMHLLMQKDFEKREVHFRARAACNLSSLYLLEGDTTQAAVYAEMAVHADKYSASAMVCKGNAMYINQEYDLARNAYLQASRLEADSVEAAFNAGLSYKVLKQPDQAVEAFRRAISLAPLCLEAMSQLADLYEVDGELKQALEWLNRLHSCVPYDAGVLARMGALHARLGDEPEALRFHQESNRTFCASTDVLTWLAAYYTHAQLYEKAAPFFELLAKVESTDAKWKLMCAGCYRRCGHPRRALQCYMEVHQLFPLNLECLRFITQLAGETGQTDIAKEFSAKLGKAERAPSAGPAAAVGAEAGASDFKGLEFDRLPGMASVYRPLQPLKTAKSGFAELLAAASKKFAPGPNMKKGATGTVSRKVVIDDDWNSAQLDDTLLPT